MRCLAMIICLTNMLMKLIYFDYVARRRMKSVANRNLRGMPLDSDSVASYNRS
ncbi:hypothetical protein EFER_3845 [Escherichia fergusonii ATCC 35469]|uniref:Uncharacterized protein n=1 Tax=Escherichia fergusonii (strain ATCC 35469 / DSM 13698 / CCUG 18766 / IAM 14443 / JCM 21226 / LMG 7866 / NBRC 102419 / NCTC 12128 / CDC 0568-73) TaxID=585054 RepID=B7LUS7_ESCF3|nr:hypothetical protein ERIG_03748 [Escherichia fergusonii B253]CAQ91280.1 hypothetical protein EFER_3845 [Escherichia fergusonii ATCC 35469]